MIKRMNLVITTLNRIAVSGSDNMNRLLGCIQELEKLRKEIEKHDDHDEPGSDA